jgi:hypothetical protein
VNLTPAWAQPLDWLVDTPRGWRGCRPKERPGAETALFSKCCPGPIASGEVVMPQWITFLAFTLVAWLSLTVGVGLLIGRLLSVAAAWRLRRRGPAPR